MNKETKDKEIKIQEKSVRIYSLCLILLSIAFPLSAFGTGILDSTPSPFTGIKEIRHLGYGRLENFTVSSDTATPFRLLSAESEVTTK